MDLNALETFVTVVRAGSFAAAARDSNTPRSSVSLRIRNLEKSLGVRLFKRSTRAFSLTAEGRELYERSISPLSSLLEALNSVARQGTSYAGEIRVTLPADFPPGILAAAISEYRTAHPAVRFQIIPTNEVLDLVHANIDLAIRIGASNPQDALIRGAIDMEFGLYASTDYLCRHGQPSSIEAIETLAGPQRPEFRRLLQGALAQGSSLPAFHIAADSFTFVRELVRMGHGVGLLPKSLCREDLASGTVAPVLADHFSGSIRLHLTYPSRADLSPKVLAFARLIERHIAKPSARPIG